MQQSFTNIGKMHILNECLPRFPCTGGQPRGDIFESCFDSHRLALCTMTVTPGPFTETLDQLTELGDIPGYPRGGWDAKVEPTKDYRLVRFAPVHWRLTDDPEGIDPGHVRWFVLTDNHGRVLVFWDVGYAFRGYPINSVRLCETDIILDLLPEVQL